MPVIHPLIDRLQHLTGTPVLDMAGINAFLSAAPGLSVLFIAGQLAGGRPETGDVAVVLTELLSHYRGRLRAALVAAASEPAVQKRYAAPVVPSLVFLRDGIPVGVLPRIKDWDEYLDAIDGWLADGPAQPDRPDGQHQGRKVA